MKNVFTLLMCCSLALGSVMAQTEPPLKPQVFKNVYFDVSPPLRDLVKLAPKHADNSWKDGVVKNNLYPFGFPKDEPMITADRTLQNYPGSSTADSLLLSYDGISNIDNLFPPDTDGDVGPNNYFQVVNLHYSIYDKAGNKLIGPIANSAMFTGLPHNSNDGDAVVLYDEIENRWIFTQFSLPTYPNGPFWEMVAISTTGDPTGSYYRYQFQFTDMPDYPKLGVWPDGIYMTSNRFSSGATNYIGTGAACFDKAAMYAGSPTASMVFFTLPSSNEAYAILPSDCDGEYPPLGTPNFFAWLKSGHIRMYAFHVDWVTPASSTYTLLCTVPVSAFNGTLSGIPQKGTSTQLDAIPGRLMFRLPFRKFSDHWAMVANATVNVSGHGGIRWWELRNDGTDPAAWTVYQESTFTPDATNRWMGSIAIDAQNNIALGYSMASSSVYPSIAYAGRVESDPLNTFSITDKTIVAGGGSQTYTYAGRSRWGDYSAKNADPSAPGKFWYTQEYFATTSSMGWKTRIGAFSFGHVLMATVSAVPNLICGSDSTQLSVSATGGSGTYTYSWTSNPAGFTSSLQSLWAHPLLSTTYIASVSDGVNTFVDSVRVTVQAPASAYAGNDTVYCNYVPVFTVHGSGIGYDQSLWSTLGDGYFDDPTALVTQYHPMALDKQDGAKLVLMVHAQLPCHGLATDTVTVLFDPCTGVNDLVKTMNISVQPNPSNGIFDLKITNPGTLSAEVVVTDLQGHPVYQQVYQASGNTINDRLNLSFLPKGSYILKVKTETGNRIEKLIIQ